MRFTRLQFIRAQRLLTPARQSKHRVWNTLEREWDARQYPKYTWYQAWWLRASVVAVLVMVVISTFGTAAYAYTSPEVTEGTALYPVKQALENAEEKLKFTPQAKAQFYVKKIQRRQAEKIVLERRNKKIEKLDEEIKNTKIKLEKIDAKLSVFEKEKTRAQLEKQQRDFEKEEFKIKNKQSTTQTRQENLQLKLRDTNEQTSTPRVNRRTRKKHRD